MRGCVLMYKIDIYKLCYFLQRFLCLPFFLAQQQSNNPKITKMNIKIVGFIFNSVDPYKRE